MKYLLLFICYSFSSTCLAQSSTNCNQLALDFPAIIETNNQKHLLLEVSNALYTGTLYNYPHFVLLDDANDTVAIDNTTYYGIGPNFQAHPLAMRKAIEFPFYGSLHLGSLHGTSSFCTYDIMIEEPPLSTLETIQNQAVKVVLSFNDKHIIIDFSGHQIDNNNDPLDYHFNITNEFGEVVHQSKTQDTFVTLPTTTLGNSEMFILSTWDNVSKRLLPAQIFFME